jgi:hypothetical protein
VSGRYEISTQAARAIADAVHDATEEAARYDAELDNYSVQHAGLEILFLFMVDLLGRTTPAAKIFREKFGQEFSHSRVVVQAQKYLCAALLLGLNAFFMYFILLKGFQKGLAWQYQYLFCCLVQLAVDLLLFETVECAWLNVVVPQFAHEEVRRAAETLHSLTLRVAKVPEDVEQADSQAQTQQQFFLNAPAHMFVSVKLAKAHPLLLESVIVGSYRHHLPGSIAQTWRHCASVDAGRELASSWTAFPRQVLRAVSLSVQLFITTPYVYQRVLLRFAQPVLFSGAGLVYYSIIESTAALTLLSAVAGCGLAYGAWRQWKASTNSNNRSGALSKIAPAEDETTSSALAPALMKDARNLWDKEIPAANPFPLRQEERAPSLASNLHETPVPVLSNTVRDKWNIDKHSLSPAMLHEAEDQVSSVEDSAFCVSPEDSLSGDDGDEYAASADADSDDGALSTSVVTEGVVINASDRKTSLRIGSQNSPASSAADVARRLSRGGADSDEESFQRLLLESELSVDGDAQSEFSAMNSDEAKVTASAEGSDYSHDARRDASPTYSEHSIPPQGSQESSWYSSGADSTNSGAIDAWLDDDLSDG